MELASCFAPPRPIIASDILRAENTRFSKYERYPVTSRAFPSAPTAFISVASVVTSMPSIGVLSIVFFASSTSFLVPRKPV